VIGGVIRTGFVINGATLSFGNPFNTVKINTGTTTAPTSISVNLAKNAAVGFSSAVLRTYTITPTGGSGIHATLRLHYRNADLNGNTPESSLHLRRFNGTGWQPVQVTASDIVNEPNKWLETNNVTAFSDWTFSTFTPTAAPSNITGHIADANGRAVEGTTIYLNGSQTRKTITDSNGD